MKKKTENTTGALTHFDDKGRAVMVDVSTKEATERTAVAEGEIRVGRKVLAAIRGGTAAKGDVLGVARVAGIMAAKRTHELIPLCHPLALSKCAVDFEMLGKETTVRARCTVGTTGRTGVEMEALTGVSAALLTIYDMTKAMNKGMTLGNIRLIEKKGGKSGHYRFGMKTP